LAKSKQMKKGIIKKTAVIGVFFILPAMIFIGYAIFVPAVWNFFLSFQKWDGFQSKQWVGLDNYIKAFQDGVLYKSLFNSIYLAVVITSFSVIAGLVLALLIYRLKRAEGAFYRLIIFMPVMLPVAIIGLLFTFMYNPEMGLVNQFLRLIGADFLTNAWLANIKINMLAISFVGIWRMSGLTMILCFAALQALPASFYEASRLDGASYIKQLTLIVLPLIKPVIQLSAVFTLIVSFKTYDLVYVMTQGGPGITTKTIPLYMIENGFGYNDFGYAAAMGFILAMVILLISRVINLLLGGEKYEY